MSSRERLLILSPKAQEDVADIFHYSLETWGEAQAEAYRGILKQAPLTIQDNPQIGQTPARTPSPRCLALASSLNPETSVIWSALPSICLI